MDILLPTLLRFLALSIRIALNLESIPVDHMGKIQRERERDIRVEKELG